MSSLYLKNLFEVRNGNNSVNDTRQRKRRLALLSFKELSTLLREIALKHDDDFHCLNCLHSFRTENKLKSHKNECKNKDFCGIVMPSVNDNIINVINI